MTGAVRSLQPNGSAAAIPEKRAPGALGRVLRYVLVRAVLLLLTVVAGVYLTILIANMGGYVDRIRRSQIQENISLSLGSNPQFRQLTAERRAELVREMVRLEEKRLGLDRPFLTRSFVYLKDAMLLSLGRAENLTSDSGSKQVRLILLERLPATLVLFATANLVLFFLSVLGALNLSRRYGSVPDRLLIALAPLSSAPSWFYGIFLILIFAAILGVLPYGGMVKAPPPDNPLEYALSLGRHLILPVSAVLISSLFLSTYNWRTFFLIYASEDYVEMAKAKGLNSTMVERRYILRPTLPAIITNFALTLITLWTGAIILETVFNWPGLGRTLFNAVGAFDTAVIVGSTVIYAYLLAMTVFLLDFIYSLVDPRVRLGGEGAKG